jgi:outer membrane protein
MATTLGRAPSAASVNEPASGQPQRRDLTAAPGWPDLLQRLDQSADLRAAQAEAQASMAVSRQQWSSAWMPRLDAQASASRQHQRYNGADTQTPGSATAITATLPVWRPAERAAASAQAAVAEQARWQARSRQVALAQELSQAWLDATEAAEQLRLTRAHLLLLDEQLRINDKRLQAGLGTVLDPLETRTRQAQTQAQADQLAARLRTAALTLERLSGPAARPALPLGLRPLADAPEFQPALLPLDDALTAAADRHPALLDARTGVQAAHDTTRSRSAEAWQPTLDATASASRTRQTQRFEGVSEQQDIRARAVGLQLNWALFTGGVQSERQSEAAALLTAAEAREDAARARLDTGLREAYQRLGLAQSRQSRLRDLVDTAQATQDAVTRAWSAGLRSHTDLLNAQQALFEARLNLANARVAAMQAAADALAWLDWLDADHIAPWMPQFDLGS